MQYMDMSPVMSSDIRNETMRDAILSQMFMKARDGFPRHEDNELLHHWWLSHVGCTCSHSQSLPQSDAGGVTQHTFRHSAYEIRGPIHAGFMWWPGIDSDIEKTVNSCDMCRQSRHKPTEATLQPWSFPDRPWTRVISTMPHRSWER